MKAVFDIWPNLKYDSDLCRRFRFQGRINYLDVAKACVGDWVIFRETKAAEGRGAYIAVAFVTGIHPEPHGFYSLSLSDYLLFDHPVGLRVAGRYAETRLLEARRPSQIGAVLQGQAMRSVYAADFSLIVRAGFGLFVDNAMLAEGELSDFSSASHLPEVETSEWKPRSITRVLQSRLFRDQVMRGKVGRAYDFTCAVTRTRNTDGHGHYEMQCAHVWSVANQGPDIVQNCIALSGSAHWLFDNYVFTINPDFSIRIIPDLIDPAYLKLFPAPGKSIHLPMDDRLWPHAKFLQYHRAEFEKRRV